MENHDKLSATVFWPADLISPSREEVIQLPLDAAERTRRLREIAGGPLQAIPIQPSRYLVFNEEGKLDAHSVNIEATMIASINEAIAMDDYIAGPAVLVQTEILCDSL